MCDKQGTLSDPDIITKWLSTEGSENSNIYWAMKVAGNGTSGWRIQWLRMMSTFLNSKLVGCSVFFVANSTKMLFFWLYKTSLWGKGPHIFLSRGNGLLQVCRVLDNSRIICLSTPKNIYRYMCLQYLEVIAEFKVKYLATIVNHIY